MFAIVAPSTLASPDTEKDNIVPEKGNEPVALAHKLMRGLEALATKVMKNYRVEQEPENANAAKSGQPTTTTTTTTTSNADFVESGAATISWHSLASGTKEQYTWTNFKTEFKKTYAIPSDEAAHHIYNVHLFA